MQEVKLLFVVLCLAALGAGCNTVYVAEDEVIGIGHTTDVPKPIVKQWYQFKEGQNVTFPPDGAAVLFEQNEAGQIKRGSAPRHMVIPDPITFQLIIVGIKLTDSGTYVAAAADSIGILSYTIAEKMTVYIQPAAPTIHTSPADLIDLSEGQNLTVTCNIPRLYPSISKVNFFIQYRGEDLCPDTPGCEFKSYIIEGDYAMNYTVSFSKILTAADKYGTIGCGVYPLFGYPTVSKPLFINVKSDEGLLMGHTEL